jgi:hypothetical protein
MYKLTTSNTSYGAVIGIDWAKDKYDIHTFIDDGEEYEVISSNPRKFRQWLLDLAARVNYQPIAIISEQSKGLLVNCLSEFSFIDIYMINTTCIKQYRRLVRPSMAKDDEKDASYIAHMFFRFPDNLKLIKKVKSDVFIQLSSNRRKKVDLRSKEAAILRACLKDNYPIVLEVFSSHSLYSKCFLAFLERWPIMEDLAGASRREIGDFLRSKGCKNKAKNKERIDIIKSSVLITYSELEVKVNRINVQAQIALLDQLNSIIEEYEKLTTEEASKISEYQIFKSIPGVADVIGPRVLAFFGTDRNRFATVEEALRVSEIAPVKRESGQHTKISRRYMCNRFNQQTFTELAACSVNHSTWAKAYYDSKKEFKQHYVIIRAIAFKWIRILYRLWLNNEHYDEEKYIEVLKKNNVHYLKYMDINKEKKVA